MAESEKRKGKDGEDYEFLPPDFDEDQFIHRELVSFKTTLILFVWGILAATVSWLLFAGVDGRRSGWLIGLLVCVAFFFALRFLFTRLGADIKHWGRREWVGTGFLFFFTWLGVFIVAINPPVSDFAPPRVDLHVGPPVQQAGGIVSIDVFYEDNDAVRSHEFLLRRAGVADVTEADLQDLGRGHYRWSQALPAGIYEVSAAAEDAEGNRDSANATFAVVDRILQVSLPHNQTLASPTDLVHVRVADEQLPACRTRDGRLRETPCIRTVHLDLADGGKVVMKHNRDRDAWEAYVEYAGWRQGTNTFNVTAEVADSWSGSVRVPGGDLTSGPHTIQVTGPTGDYVPKVLNDPGAPVRAVPGIGLPLLVAAILAGALVVRRVRG